ncbi:A.superbus venom factor 1-like [Mauremys reevesii]|uniref:A.superbus venom factor 1-like n=1 Tax=Mauremys reevesii TaxID=260615 RepID=UPI00193F8D14|nr:A.superbus venom factor 1-like [Mauremys reevesii]
MAWVFRCFFFFPNTVVVQLQALRGAHCQRSTSSSWAQRVVRRSHPSSPIARRSVPDCRFARNRWTDEDPQGKTRPFISHIKCRESLRLERNKDYLIWGLRTDLWPRKAELSYIIGKDTWIEKWPNEDECRKPDFQNLCQEFLEFSEAMTMFGCPV